MSEQKTPSPAEPVPDDAVPRINPMYLFRWEERQQAYLLLYPEGIVKLNGSAGEILRRCDGSTCVSGIVADLERSFGATDLREDVQRFLETSHAKGWIRLDA
ncbi:pyrroloquinoline quinone biosynthesis peptide chaperone PqqD [Arhodomonas sp. AD133]|uniref:pyrroloquinoline quinone biosynthesis peptide chaperone PqqD n=1 Tax=Arhodomonas sp. AD133 TaxID=3415009 RepID=UPI003EBC263F